MEAVAEVRFIGGVFYKGVRMCNPGSFLILSSGWSALSGPVDLCGSAALAGVFVRGGSADISF